MAVLAVVLVAVIAVFAVIRIGGAQSVGEFTPPSFEASAKEGTPDEADDSYNSLEFPALGTLCKVFMDASPKLDGDKLSILFTSLDSNTPWIRIEIYDNDKNKLGESGLIRPGEYLESITLSDSVTSGDTLQVKVLTYEPDTYYSMGTIKAELLVR